MLGIPRKAPPSPPRAGRISALLAAAALAALPGGTAAQAQTVVTLPFETDFEAGEGYAPGPLASDPVWRIGAGLDAAIVTPGAGSDQALNFFGRDALELFTDSGSAPVSWVDFYLKPVFVEPLELPAVIETERSAVTGFVKVDAGGEVHAIDGDGLGGGAWLPSGERRTLQGESSADWIRLTYRLDYAAKTWDLFVDGAPVLTDLGFLDDSVSALDAFALRADAETGTPLDYFYAGNDNPLHADTSNDGLPDAWLTAQGLGIHVNQRAADPDLDGLDTLLEYRLGTAAANPDSDSDGVHDGLEHRAGADPALADAYALAALPFFENFESYAAGPLAGRGDWTVTGDAADIRTAEAGEGAQALELGGASSAARFLDGSATAQSVVWIDLRLKPAPSAEAPGLPEDVAVAYHFDPDGRPVVFDGSGGQGSGFWKLLDAARSNDWRRVTVKLDYAAQAYDFYLDGERLGAGLGFAHAQPYANRLAAEGATLLDGIAVTATTEPEALDDDRDGLTNAEEAAAGTDPLAFDTDGDGLADSLELLWGLDPGSPDAALARTTPDGGGAQVWTASFAAAEGYAPGPLDGQNGWTASGTAEVAAEEEAALADSASADTSLARHIGVGDERRIWVSFRAALVPGELPGLSALAEPAAALWGAAAEDRLAVWDGTASEWTPYAVPAALGAWQDYALHLDYVDKAWSLYLNGAPVAEGIPFRDRGLAALSRFKALRPARGPGTDPAEARIDDLRIATTEPTGMDFDGDGLTNDIERQLGGDLHVADTDGDGMDDLWEYENGLDLSTNDAAADADGDGLPNTGEYAAGTDPNAADSDGDGYLDGEEAIAGTSPVDSGSLPDSRGYPGWSVTDIGPIDPSEVFTVGNSVVMQSDGKGLSGVADDSLGFLHRAGSGDFSMVIRVKDFERDNWKSVLSLMVRGSTGPASEAIRFGGRGDDDGRRYRAEIRRHAGEAASRWNLWSHPKYFYPNRYLRLTRRGDRVSFEVSGDGASYHTIESVLADLGSDFRIGIGLSSGDLNSPVRAEFKIESLRFDSDQDGLWDDEESALGTNPLLADSDGDGWSDSLEVNELHSDPNAADLGGVTEVLSVGGSSYAAASGTWSSENGEVYAIDSVGSLDYLLDVPEPGAYRLVLAVSDHNEFNGNSARPFDLRASLGGISQGVNQVFARHGAASETHFYLPRLAAGQYPLRIDWLNGNRDARLRIHAIRLERIEGPDADQNGIADWEDHRIARSSLEAPAASLYVSPVCLEGADYAPETLAARSWPTGSPATIREETVEPALAHSYFLDVHLEPGETRTVEVEGHAGLRQSSLNLEWTAFNLFEHSAIRIRLGDSLLLAAFDPNDPQARQVPLTLTAPDGTVESFTISSDARLQALFDQSGPWTVEAALPRPNGEPGLELSAGIVVASADLSPAPILVRGTTRNWRPGFSDGQIALESDDSLILSEKASSGGPREFSLAASSDEGRVLARLEEDGPILDAVPVHVIRDQSRTKTHDQIVETFPDGTVMVRAFVLLSEVPDDLEVILRIFKSGVTFADGTLRRNLTAADFDETGRYQFFMLRSPGVRGGNCHRITYRQNGATLGGL